MTPETITLYILTLFVLGAVGLLLVGARLLRHERNRSADHRDTLPSRTFEHLRPIQNIAVEFFARTEPCARLLSVVAGHNHALSLDEALRKAQPTNEHSNTGRAREFVTDWAALGIMALTGLITFSRRGVAVTDTGREVHRRISSPPPTSEQRPQQSFYDSLFVPVRADTGTSSHIQRVREALYPGRSVELPSTPVVPCPTKLGELRTLRPPNASHPSINSQSTHTTSMKKHTIIMTAADHEALSYAIAAAEKLSARGRAEMSALEAELARAEIVDAGEIPADVITMNSRAELLDLATRERMKFTLVLPIDADINRGKISVLAPLGTAMLGQRVGDEFKWNVPYGLRRLKVVAVHWQPETALALAA